MFLTLSPSDPFSPGWPLSPYRNRNQKIPLFYLHLSVIMVFLTFSLPCYQFPLEVPGDPKRCEQIRQNTSSYFVLANRQHIYKWQVFTLFHSITILTSRKRRCSSYSSARFSLPAWRTRQPISTLTLNKNSIFYRDKHLTSSTTPLLIKSAITFSPFVPCGPVGPAGPMPPGSPG